MDLHMFHVEISWHNFHVFCHVAFEFFIPIPLHSQRGYFCALTWEHIFQIRASSHEFHSNVYMNGNQWESCVLFNRSENVPLKFITTLDSCKILYTSFNFALCWKLCRRWWSMVVIGSTNFFLPEMPTVFIRL